jgi:hypothetical protein
MGTKAPLGLVPVVLMLQCQVATDEDCGDEDQHDAVITEFSKAGSRAFHLEFRYMVNQLPPTVMKPKKKTSRPVVPTVLAIKVCKVTHGDACRDVPRMFA